MQMDATRTASTHVILRAGRTTGFPAPELAFHPGAAFVLYYLLLNSNQNAVLLNDSSLKAR
jgi:hypothetical protein